MESKGREGKSIVSNNAYEYANLPTREDAFKDGEVKSAIENIMYFSMLNEEDSLQRDFIYNYDKYQLSILIDEMADIATKWATAFAKKKKPGPKKANLPQDSMPLVKEAKKQIALLYGIIKRDVGLSTGRRTKYRSDETRIQDSITAVLGYFDKNESSFPHIDRDLLEDRSLYIWGQPKRDFGSRLLAKIIERRKWATKVAAIKFWGNSAK
ncbi:hypothetical protein DSCA_60020 [Desulfosarcina alkanivorans]|uniref:Uncharacterized protein n=1 Tax=Desulfosarcina alkanivorans TaxID=571177 RepID=A0A5K7YQL4_9BACT|nr:hypothetical protein [Desulfosarcina alkanivorans]BBO72072.1 hypothetical protein DSCA_60020 [Desulfosarcina alkanivorans]